MTPVVLAFIIPLALILFIYISILILYVNRVHHRRLMRRLREAVTERDILKAGRDIVAALGMVRDGFGTAMKLLVWKRFRMWVRLC